MPCATRNPYLDPFYCVPAEGQHWVSPSYLCRIVDGTPSIREPGKCSAIAWFAPDAMPEELTEVTRVNLKNYLKHRLTGSA